MNTIFDQEIQSALRLKLVQGVGPRTFDQLVARFGSAQAALEAAPAELRAVDGVGSKLVREISDADQINVSQQLKICRDNEIEILLADRKPFPKLLDEIVDAPPVLFCRGDLKPEDELAVAIVGTRRCSNYGRKVAGQLARGLAMAGITIVSGLARGIDAAAHQGALEIGGRTIAVLGGGHLNLYPPEHADLAEKIQQSGAIVTESLPTQAPKSGSFPRRNRIISGLSLGVIVVEAGQRSGALISARLAAEQGREVFAVPGRIDSRVAMGCHRLIRDGAKLVESVDDVLEELGPLPCPVDLETTKKIKNPIELKLTDQESSVLNVIKDESTELDWIVQETQLPPARVLSTISVLEIRRLIRRVSGTAVVRI
ncbi:MAG: DNA-processing protein DprA [Planctomycetota bacterium]